MTEMYFCSEIFTQDLYANYAGLPNLVEFLEFQITTDCSVLIDSVFFVLCAYFDGSMVFFDEFCHRKVGIR